MLFILELIFFGDMYCCVKYSIIEDQYETLKTFHQK